MRSGLILAIDQGTTNTKALLVDGSGFPVFRTSAAVPLRVLPNGFVEQDPRALWESARNVSTQACTAAREFDAAVEAIAISNQRETALAWNAETGQPVANAIGWQCGRAGALCDRLARHSAMIRARTGLPLAPLISAAKWAWMLENDPAVQSAAQAGTLRFGTVDAWLVSQSTRGTVDSTDLTNASRTGLLNLHTLQWDHDLLDLFGIPAAAMPTLRTSAGSFGISSAIEELEGVPILAAIGDSHAAMFGHGRYGPGSVKATYGTGSSLMALTSSLASDTPNLARTIAWSIAGTTQFALEGNIAMTGSAVQWLGEFLRLPDPASDVAALARTVPDAAGVYFVPAMMGLGAPHWDAQARGSVTGLGRSHTAAHLARAALDAIAYQVADVFFAMQDAARMQFAELRADGGATRNEALMQFQSDILGRPVLRSANEELSALGAAWLAGLALGWWKTPDELEALPHGADRFAPVMDGLERDRLYAGWTRAVTGVRTTRPGSPTTGPSSLGLGKAMR